MSGVNKEDIKSEELTLSYLDELETEEKVRNKW